MLFSSIPFLYFFLPATVAVYLLAPKKLKNAVLLLFSLAFYAWGEKKLVLLFAGTILTGWILGLLIEKCRSRIWRKVLLILSVTVDLGLLGYFKYADFFISTFNSVFGLSIPLLRVVLPIGISFYTFQILSYTVDVYRENVPAQKNLINFAAYVALFPQLIAGPIVRYADIAEQLQHRTHTVDKVASGIRRFIIGLGKKVLLANVFGELCANFRATSDPSVLYCWLYAVGYMLQIYFDFSGYSDMAIGLGRMFGFDFKENFNYPYISKSVTDFWRRWHISLGSWFRDYVYIPLGGNRGGLAKQLRNIAVVWMLTGFWHGANWNFILWGLLYAILLAAEKLGMRKWLEQHGVLGHIYVLLTAMLGFILFNADSMGQAFRDAAGLVSFGRLPAVSAEALYYLRSNAVIFLLGIAAATPFPVRLLRKLAGRKSLRRAAGLLEPVALVVVLLLVTAYLVDGSFNPFLYFRF